MSKSIPLSGDAAPAFKFERLGDSVVGRIVDLDQRDQTDPAGNLVTFSDGRARKEVVITLEQPDGERTRIFARGGSYEADEGEGASMWAAISEAARAAGETELSVGPELAVAFTGYGKAKPGKNRPKLYSAACKPPAPAQQSVALDGLFSRPS